MKGMTNTRENPNGHGFPSIKWILKHQNFTPLREDFAEDIEHRVLKIVKMPPVTESEVKDAVTSLGALFKNEVLGMGMIQDRFCVQCGECCRICDPINIHRTEMKRIAEYLHIKPKKLRRRVKATKWRNNTFNVKGAPCPFLRGDQCGIYSVRPAICRGYPVIGLLDSHDERETRPEIPEHCPGMKDMLALAAATRIARDRMMESPQADEFLQEIKSLQDSMWGKGTPSEQVQVIGNMLKEKWAIGRETE